MNVKLQTHTGNKAGHNAPRHIASPALCCCLLLFSSGPDARAADDSPGKEGKDSALYLGVTWPGGTDLYGQINPLGLKLIGSLDYRNTYRYSSTYEAASGYREAGAKLGVTPAYLQPSVHAAWMPWIMAIVNVEYAGYYFYGC